ncbi:MAG: heterodisulfide reductase subunit C [bacterium]|nr:heterodisulfide reductase subunit C [bacterium]
MNDENFNENPSLCYQCGKCSTGCPVAEDMDILPHQILHLLSLGMEHNVLDKKTIWLCAGCYTCAVRCPNDIDITSVMDHLRQKAIENNIPCPLPEILHFHTTFIKDLSRRGKIFELRMMCEYNLRIKKPLNNAALAPKMIRQGKLKLKPPKRVKGFKKWLKQSSKSNKAK